MKKVLAVVLAFIVLIAIWGIGTRNSLISMSEEVKLQESQVQTQLQRRSDLIPNFVATVKGYATHEENVYTAIAEARTKLNGAIKSNDVDAINEANSELDSALSRLLVVVENYPELKASQNFIALQDELAGTENRISIAREKYNSTVASYNKEIKKFPKNIIANMCGLTEAKYFEASEKAQEVPTVNF